MQDELGPDGRHLGWADRVAAAMATAPRWPAVREPRDPGAPARPGRRRAGAGRARSSRPTWCRSTPGRTTYCARAVRPSPPSCAGTTTPCAPARAAGIAGPPLHGPRAGRRHGSHGRPARGRDSALQRRRPRHGCSGAGRSARRRRPRAGAARPPALARGPAAPRPGGARAGRGRRARDARRRTSPRCSAASPAGGASRCRRARPRRRSADLVADVRWVRRYLTALGRTPGARACPAATAWPRSTQRSSRFAPRAS